jgi:tRNA (cmo5U34)-methyltransferase
MNSEHSIIVKEHFNLRYTDYDNLIQKLIPNYKQMHKIAIGKILQTKPGRRLAVLDLGVGTGQTALELLNKHPGSRIMGVDISPHMLSQSRLRLQSYSKRIELMEQDIANLKVQDKYDACVAILSVHHLDEQQKQQLFEKVWTLLKKNGIFVIADIVKFETKKETKHYEALWKKHLIRRLGRREGKYWYNNYLEEDLPSSVPAQLRWLKESGFQTSECLWHRLNYAVFCGRRT